MSPHRNIFIQLADLCVIDNSAAMLAAILKAILVAIFDDMKD